MRVLVCGSRTWTLFKPVMRVIEKLPSGAVVIEGGARGADSIARVCAEEQGLEVKEFKADWNRFGKGAGFRRNKQMLDEGQPDVVFAFIDTGSASVGTRMMIELAEAKGVRVVVVKMKCADFCPTCEEPYTNPPTQRAFVCSDAFHACHDCVIRDGIVIEPCNVHANDA